MKMQEPELAFVDGLYAKFYSLPSGLLRVGPKCTSSSARFDSFHPAEAVAGKQIRVSVRRRVVRHGQTKARAPESRAIPKTKLACRMSWQLFPDSL